MPLFFIKRPKNKPEIPVKKSLVPHLPEGEVCIVCSSCKKNFFVSDLQDSFYVCSKCGLHLRASARDRMKMFADEGNFEELFATLSSTNIIDFPDYDGKLKKAKENSLENEGILCAVTKVDDIKCAVFTMNPQFMMGSMGTVVGEKIALLFEYALEHSLPIVGFTISGGARMQEGILSLMQMAKTSAAVKRHSDAGLLYITVICDPTTGGVTASFAMLGDIILAEPKALIGFAGPRVIEQTIRQKLPTGFQTAEFLLEKGFIDKIVPRKEQRQTIAAILRLHGGKKE